MHRRALPPPVPPEQLSRDPLIHDKAESSRAAALIAALVVGAAIAHVVVTLVIGVAGRVLHSGGDSSKDEKVEVTINDEPPPKEEEKPPEKPPEKPDIDTAPEKKPEPKARVEKQTPPETTQPETTPPPRVGLSLESTVGEGDGPAFAVGDTRLGSTAETAPDPNAKPPEKKPEPDKKPEPVQRNRKSQNIPAGGAGDELVKPKRSQRVEPDYPPELRAQGIEANVVVQVQIDATGVVTKVDIIAPAPQAAFNEAARAAALREQFAPATRGGKAIPFTLSFTYRFRIGTK